MTKTPLSIEPPSWDDKYLIGIDELDTQHKLLIDEADRVGKWCQETQDNHLRVNMLSELASYIKFHFLSEENMMSKLNYPDYEIHKENHQKMIDMIAPKLANISIQKDGDISKDIVNLVESISEWFIYHTKVDDRLFGEYLKSID